MELLMNDLSVYGQFHNFESFVEAIDRLMIMRNKCRKFGREIYCHRNMVNAQVTKELNMQQVVQRLDKNKKSALMQWLTRQGPYWEDKREHNPEDYLEYKDEIVTDTAIGEAASRCFKGNDCRVVSMTPSRWNSSPLRICWRRSDDDSLNIDVQNHFDSESLEEDLRSSSEPINSWDQLDSICRNRFIEITFSMNAFEPLFGHPFSPGVAQRIIERIEVLEKLKTSVDQLGNRTAAGHRLYQEHFTGDKAWFSDSSDDEKRDFKSELTFKHPNIDGSTLFCAMHGKVKTPQIRIHFSSPIQSNLALYVVYVGPKITKR